MPTVVPQIEDPNPVTTRTSCTVVPYDPNSIDPTILAYEYLKFYRGSYAPEDMLPSPLKENFVDHMDELLEELEGRTFAQALGDLEEAELIDEYAKGKFEDLASRLAIPEDLDETITWLRDEIEEAREADEESCYGRYLVLSVFQTFRNAMQYYSEVAEDLGYLTDGGGSGIETRSSECSFWDRIDCLFSLNTLLSAIVGATIGCNVGNIIEGDFPWESFQFDLSTLTFVLSCVGTNIHPIGAAIGAVAGIFYGVFGDGCICVNCDGIDAVTAYPIGCQPRARFTPWGFGEDIDQLDWINTNGNPSIATTYPTAPALTITHVSSASMLNVQISPICEEPSENPPAFQRSYNLYLLSITPLQLFLSGGPIVAWETGEILEYVYYVVGVNLDRYVIDFTITNGTIESETSNSVTVTWDDEETGELCIEYYVNCTGGQALETTYCITVTIDDIIP
ncbi:MAG TPA: hypothetical protein VI603_05800 [Saprospiraceae bacterium]|nr:hypothetical protein [Saprospiraceae bacterium]